ncbi:DNA repair protein complementing XP-C cells [Petromyzon marinus]|uniref:DNA repair protein complementing XP-C cells n=1 Tax=Petromyzon marinus TaxID=7757 RepID=A0AAJ7XA42_PETMA|nr:DNA repair protein complementing XP-C cells [Petromyzon marinus]
MAKRKADSGTRGSRARGCNNADGPAQERASKRISRKARGRRGGARGGRVEPADNGEARDSVATTSQRGAAEGGPATKGEACGASKERAASRDEGQREPARAVERVTAEGSGRKRAASESDSEENDLEGKSDEEDSSSDSESEGEWQEVDELPAEEEVGATSSAAGIVSIGQAVQIEIETPEMAKLRARKEKRKKLFEGWVRRMANRYKKEVQLDLHKVHLLCLLANGMHRSAVCSSPALRALALSLLPTQLASSPSTNHDLTFLARLLTWFNFTFRVDEEEEVQGGTAQGALMTEVLTARFSSRTARSAEELSHLFLVVVRALGITSRLVLSLQPLPLKSAAAEPKVGRFAQTKTRKGISKQQKSTRQGPGDFVGDGEDEKTRGGGDGSAKVERGKRGEARKKSSSATSQSGDVSKAERFKEEGKGEKVEEEEDGEIRKCQGAGENEGKRRSPRVSAQQSSKPQAGRYRVAASDSDGSGSDEDSEFSPNSGDSSDEVSDSDKGGGRRSGKSRKRPSSQQRGAAGKRPTGEKEPELGGDSDSDDFVATTTTGLGKHKRAKMQRKSPSHPKAAWKPGATSTALAPCNAWVEVLLVAEGPHGRAPVGAAAAGGRWVCVEVAGAEADRPEACVRRAARPLAYVVAFDDDGCMKDITRRYDPAWLTSTRRLRVDAEWWQAALFPFESPHTHREQQEDEQLEAGLLSRPMPSSVSEFKSHPLYALPRHLLKYEAIFPPGAAVLGTCRGEPVYARECVHTLHSCDTWLKQARVVRLGEVPYKMVKGQSNRSRKLRMADPESRDKPDLALFGLWQTEEYQPPVAVDGKVPRNDYGNVYLFRPSMLPVGCVHLHAPGLNRVARSIGVDCAPAVTGFDFHAGYSHPVTDGFVVCEEVKDTLLAAWERAQEEVEKKEREKRENRAFGNWKLLTRGLLIRERLKLRYSANEPGSTQTTQGEEGTSQVAKNPGVTPADDLAVAWPDFKERTRSSVKRNQGVGRRDRQGQNSHLFPFEKL